MAGANGELDFLLENAIDQFRQGAFENAVEGFLRVEQSAQAMGNLRLTAEASMILGASYAELGNLPAAYQALLRACDFYRSNGDLVGECKSHISLGAIYERMEHWEDARQTWQTALDIARRMFNSELAEIALDGLAHAYVKLGQPQEGCALYEKLVKYFEKAGDQRKQVDTLIKIIRVKLDLGDTRSAEKNGQYALYLARQLKDKPYEAYCQYKLGSVYLHTGNNNEAHALLTNSANTYRDLDMEDELGLALNSLGMVCDNLGLYQDALSFHQETLKMSEKCGDKLNQGSALHGIGSVYHKVGRFDEAQEYYRRALALTEEAGDLLRAADTLTNLGVIAADMGRDDEALPLLQQALFYQKKFGNQISQGHTLISISALHQRNDDYDQALAILKDALVIHQETGDRNSQAVALNAIGEILINQQRFKEALDIKAQALDLFRKISNPVGQIHVLYAMARLYASTGNFSQAVIVLDDAIQKIENMRLNIISESLRTDYFSHMQNIFALYVDVLIAMERQEDAFYMVERSKARSFLDLLTEAQSSFLEDLDPALSRAEQELLSEMDRVTKQINALRVYDEDQFKALKLQLQELERSYQINQAEIRKRNPRYSALTQPNIWGIDQVQKELLDEHTALLEYILGENVSTLFVVLKHTFQVFRLPPRAEIELRVKELRASLTLHRYLHGDSLYRDLIQPAESLIQGKDLLIVADGVLHYLPFSLLLTNPPLEGGGKAVGLEGELRSAHGLSEDTQMTERIAAQMDHLPPFDFPNLPYLVLKYPIRYIPSASVGCFMEKELQYRTSGRTGGLQFTALADPLISEQTDFKAGALRSLHPELAPLPYTNEEVWALAGLFERGIPSRASNEFQSNYVNIYTGEKATKAKVLALTNGSQDFRFLHIATHGLLDIENPQFSGLLFSSLNYENPYWQTFEIFKAQITAETVVLSACETGLGKVIHGEGLVGLSRAFLYAGASRVCVSLWKVADISTPGLMKKFYQEMLAGKQTAEALRQAQLDLITEQTYSHPFFWAAFVLVGKN